MNKCVICGKESKGKYCSGACKQRAYRNKSNAQEVTSNGPKVTGVTESVTQGVTLDTSLMLHNDVTPSITKTTAEDIIPNYGQPDCQCMHCQQARANHSKNRINHGPRKTINQLAKHEVNRVALPGDPDYDGVCYEQPAG